MKMAQAWFVGGSSGGQEEEQKAAPSLLAEWNSYASSRDEEMGDGSSAALGFDLEAAVRTANDKVSGTFNV